MVAPKLQAELPLHYSMAGFVVSYGPQLPRRYSLHDAAFLPFALALPIFADAFFAGTPVVIRTHCFLVCALPPLLPTGSPSRFHRD